MLGAAAVKSGGSKTPPRAVPALPEEGDPFSSLGQRILHLMKINDLTKAEFSRLVGVHQSTVGLWVAGKREEITSEVADRIVEKTGATLAWVMRGRGAPPKSLVEQRIERSQVLVTPRPWAMAANGSPLS